MIAKILFIFICFGLFINQAGRIDLGNNIAFTVLDISVSVFLLYTLLVIKKNNQVKSKDLFRRPFLIFILLALISLLANIFRYTWQQDLISGLYLIRFVIYCLMYKAIQIQFVKSKQFVVISLVTTSIALLIAGLMQYFFYSNLRNLYYLGWDDHLYRLFSTFFDPNFAGSFMVLMFLFICMLFSRSLKKHNKISILLVFLLLTGLLEIFLFLKKCTDNVICLFIRLSFLLKKTKYVLLIILTIIFIYFIVAPSSTVENTNFLRSASSLARLKSEQTVIQVIIKNPVLGVGFDAYRYAQVQYGYRTLLGAQTSHADSGTDSSLLFVFATTGVFGFIAYIFLQYRILKILYSEFKQKKSVFSILLIASLCGLYIDSFFINSLFYPSILLWMMILLGVRDYT